MICGRAKRCSDFHRRFGRTGEAPWESASFRRGAGGAFSGGGAWYRRAAFAGRQLLPDAALTNSARSDGVGGRGREAPSARLRSGPSQSASRFCAARRPGQPSSQEVRRRDLQEAGEGEQVADPQLQRPVQQALQVPVPDPERGLSTSRAYMREPSKA